MDTKEKRIRIFYPPHIWAEVRKRICNGQSMVSVAKVYGMTRQAIRNRAEKECWPVPRVLEAQRRELEESGMLAPVEKEITLPHKVESVDSLQMQESCVKPPESPISRFHAALMSLVESPPADFQAAFAGVAQAAIAEGLPEIPAPRSIKELATWFDLWRKAAGLDLKEKTAGITPLVNPMRTVSRRAGGMTVEVDPVPGTPEYEAWEV